MDGDFIIMLEDLSDEEGNVAFAKGKKYEILDENDVSLYVKIKGNQVSQFSKNMVGHSFNYVN